MGFGSILNLQITQTPSMLGHWLLMNYDHRFNELNIGSSVINITATKVHEVLGIPMGKIPVLDRSRPRLGDDTTTDMFKNQFPTPRITINHVREKLTNDQGVGDMFKINFLVLFNTCIGFITKSTTINQRFISAIDNLTDIPNMDRCGYVIENLKMTKEEWKDENEQYNGPITFLTMLYTHEYQKKYGTFGAPVTTPVVNYITTTTLGRMKKYLHNNGPPVDDDSENEEYAPAYENVENEEAKDDTADAAAAYDVAASGEIAATGDKITPEIASAGEIASAADNTVDIPSADKPAQTVGGAPAGENAIHQPDTDGDYQKHEADGGSETESDNADHNAEGEFDDDDDTYSHLSLQMPLGRHTLELVEFYLTPLQLSGISAYLPPKETKEEKS
ncbi:uncharacterized protein LOC143596757 [Bidens hawaiensis]|uniref:uncharacterized protein LOC143596757 n=1 Tax=Bidens hawaiensis TaxID=980011 RepID=UPI00404A5721